MGRGHLLMDWAHRPGIIRRGIQKRRVLSVHCWREKERDTRSRALRHSCAQTLGYSGVCDQVSLELFEFRFVLSKFFVATPHTVYFEGFVASEFEGYVAECAPHKAKAIASRQVDI